MASAAILPDRFGGAGQRPQGLSLTYQRLMLMMLVFAGVTMLIAGRLLFLQLFTDRAGAGQIGNPLIPLRADIVDRNGMPLARTIDAWSIAVHPDRLLGNPAELAVKLAELMPERSAAEYKAMLTSGKTFLYLSRRAVPELVAAVNALGEPAIEFSREPAAPLSADGDGRPHPRLDRFRRPRSRRDGAGARAEPQRPGPARHSGRPVDRRPGPGRDGGRAQRRDDQVQRDRRGRDRARHQDRRGHRA